MTTIVSATGNQGVARRPRSPRQRLRNVPGGQFSDCPGGQIVQRSHFDLLRNIQVLRESSNGFLCFQ